MHSPEVEASASSSELPTLSDRDALAAEFGLSERELAVLSLVTEAMSNKDIAATLFISENTLKTNIRTAYRRIGVDSRAQAVLWGVHHGLLEGYVLVRKQPDLVVNAPTRCWHRPG